MPDGEVDALGNFGYIVNSDAGLGKSVKPLPWEFLLFVIDHKTPFPERRWAFKYFASQRGRVTSWHKDVPYDKGMLQTEQTGKGPGPKLTGHEYTLENIKRYGGVCAQQADFVARVAKSLGQPTVYVSGESSYRGWHAWVMWVTVVKPGKDNKVRFNLVSDGRTRGFERDAFYTGWITDPQTGQRILDRDMERRLTVVGNDPPARRQASLAMRAYPGLCESLTLNTKDRIAYLDRVLQLVPRCEEAWVEFARLAREGELSGTQRGVASAKLAALTKTFAPWPDFIARLSDDLLVPETNATQKIKHYQAIVAMFEKAGRPDLCCDVRLKIAKLHGAQKRYKEATQALTQAVRKFPTEGRYIPRLLEACEKVCENYPAGVKTLAGLYLELAPALVLHYKGEKNPFLDKVIKQGETFYEKNNLTKQAQTFQARVAQAKARAGS